MAIVACCLLAAPFERLTALMVLALPLPLMRSHTYKMREDDRRKLTWAATAAGIVGVGWAVSTRYKTARAHEWLVRSGFMIKDMQIGKQFVQWPYQHLSTINLTPTSFHVEVHAMSKEKMDFRFPVVFTIGVRNEPDALERYSRYLLAQYPEKTDALVRGIVEGEARTLAANLSIEDIFSARAAFKSDITAGIQKELDQYGLEVQNSNVEELGDGDDSQYFKSLSQKVEAEAQTKAKIDIAEQRKRGDIGAKEREAETRQRVAVVEAETALVENIRSAEMIKSKAELDKTREEQKRIVQEAALRAEQEVESLRMQMQKEVEERRHDMMLAQQRAEELSRSQVASEVVLKTAEGDANAKRVTADAALYAKQREAQGVEALYAAQAAGLARLVAAFGGDARALLSYTMVEKGVYEKLADANAKAIKDLHPKITVWTNDASKGMDAVSNLGKAVIPMIDTIADQTGYKLPDWMLQKSASAAPTPEEAVAAGKTK